MYLFLTVNGMKANGLQRSFTEENVKEEEILDYNMQVLRSNPKLGKSYVRRILGEGASGGRQNL